MWPTRDPAEQVEVLRWMSWNDSTGAGGRALLFRTYRQIHFWHWVARSEIAEVESLTYTGSQGMDGHLNGRERVRVED